MNSETFLKWSIFIPMAKNTHSLDFKILIIIFKKVLDE